MSDLTHTYDSFVYKTDRPWPNPPLTVGTIVGHATPTSTRLWLRTGWTGEFSLLLYPRDRFADAASRRELRERLARVPLTVEEALALLPGSLRTDFNIEDPDSDTTIVLDLENLTPDTRYGYVLHARDAVRVLLGHNRVREFRTPSAYGERRPFQFALFSCHMPYKQSGLLGKRTEVRNLEMWDFLGREQFDRFRDWVTELDPGEAAYLFVDPGTGECWFKLYRKQKLDPPPSLDRAETVPLNHSVAKIRLRWPDVPGADTGNIPDDAGENSAGIPGAGKPPPLSHQ